MQRLVHLSHLSCIRHRAGVASWCSQSRMDDESARAEKRLGHRENSENERRNEKQGGVKSGHRGREREGGREGGRHREAGDVQREEEDLVPGPPCGKRSRPTAW